MDLLFLFRWLEQTSFSAMMRESQWGFASVETVHLLALAALGGAIILLDLRLLGVRFGDRPAAQVAHELAPIFFISLALMIISGATLVAGDPLRYYYNDAFRWKIVAFSIAVLVHVLVRWKTLPAQKNNQTTILAKISAIFSLSLWTIVGLAGRAIGFI